MLDGIPFNTLTPPVLIAITVLLVLLGKLVPRIFYTEKVREAEKWQKAYETEREARRLSDSQTAQLLEQAKTTHQMVEAMFNASERMRQSGGTNVVPTP